MRGGGIVPTSLWPVMLVAILAALHGWRFAAIAFAVHFSFLLLTFVSTHLSATHLAVDALRILAEPWRVQEEKRKKKDEVVQQALGARIRQLREKKGWSQEDFA